MNKPVRNIAAITALLALVSMASAQQAAAADKPALTIAFAGYDKLIEDLKALDELSGHTKLAEMAEGGIKANTQGKGLEGLDKSRPWGILVTVGDDLKPGVQGFVPVTDLKALMAAVPGHGDASDKGVYEIPAGEKSVYVKQKGKWAVLSDSEDSLDNIPEDPAAEFSDLTKKYLLSMRGSAENVPDAVREKAITTLRGLIELGMAMQNSSAPPEQQAMMKANMKQMFDKLEKLGKELKSITIGLGLDSSSKSIFLDVETQARKDTDLARKFADLKEAKTDFAGFELPGAAMTILSAGIMEDDDVADMKSFLDRLKKIGEKSLDDNEALGDKREVGKKLIADLVDVGEKTLSLKRTDGGLAILLNDGPVAIAGARIAEGKKLEATIKKLVEEVGKDDPALKELINFDVEKYEGVNFHTASIPIPDREAARIFGDTVTIAVGISESSLYFGAGKEPIAKIKEVIDGSKASPGKAINPAEVVISGIPIAKFFAKVIPGENRGDAEAKKNFKKAASMLEKAADESHVRATIKAIEDGDSMRLKVESGVVKTILNLIPMGGEAPDESNEN